MKEIVHDNPWANHNPSQYLGGISSIKKKKALLFPISQPMMHSFCLEVMNWPLCHNRVCKIVLLLATLRAQVFKKGNTKFRLLAPSSK